MVARIQELERDYPSLIEVYTTQSQFGLTAAGTCFIGGQIRDCDNYVVRITNEKKLTKDTPEVFISGALHGDERVGPTAVTEFAVLLIEMYVRGDAWARVLVDTRSTTIMPVPNALGYSQRRREENGKDPNRDFAWDQNPHACMTTIAGQSINEVWRRHIFQLSLTFHGGTHLISYPWGDFLHCCKRDEYTAPDMTGMEILTEHLQKYVGQFSGGERMYRIGALNDIIYRVHGGMEDWAYGASWDHQGNVQCTGGESVGYDKSRTVYNNATHRAVNLLVETASAKTPSESTLGTNKDVIMRGGGQMPGGGHIPRNIRLCWMMVDAVQPWVRITNVDTFPTTVSEGVSVTVTWDVGGAFQVDSGKVECLGEGETEDAHELCDSEHITRHKLWGTSAPVGTAHRSLSTDFHLLDGAAARSGGRIRVRVSVMVDQEWGAAQRPEHKKGKPQSHLVRARTDETWHFENRFDGYHEVVQGRLWWHSQEVEITAQASTLPRRRK
mmetsp:Transcript_62860/g.147947  ORF Transcript_62860/g.147947 Transcript_62860/m.147947 type:complete len:498 (+) Transcript_62860:346-1839(+)